MLTHSAKEKGRLHLQWTMFLGAVVLVFSAAAVIGYLEWKREQASLFNIFDQQLATNNGHTADYLQEQFKRFREDVRVLTMIPPIAGYVRATRNHGIDPLRGETTDAWLDRMATIFTAFMKPNPLYTRISFIGVADHGRVIVRIDQIDGKISRVPKEQLDQLDWTETLRETSKLPAGEIFVSTISYSREHGKLDTSRPMMRTATPVYASDGELIGIMLLNVDFFRLCARAERWQAPDVRNYVLNADTDFLWHPNKERTFGFSFGKPYRLTDQFRDFDLSVLGELSVTTRVQSLATGDGKMRVTARRFPINPAQPERTITLVSEFPERPVAALLANSRDALITWGTMAALLIIGAILLLLRLAFRPLAQMAEVAQAIARGDYFAELPQAAGIETAALRDAFAAMQMTVAAREGELLKHRDHLQELVGIATTEVTAIVQSAVNGIITADQDGIIKVFNPAAEKLFGWTSAEVVGKDIGVLMPETTAAEHHAYIDHYLRTGEAKIIGQGREITARRRDGSCFPAYLAIGHARFSERRHFFVAFVSDITLQKERESELLLAKEAAEAAAHAKSEFLSNMSHEIRTPMNAILGLAYLLEKQELPAESCEMVDKITGAGRSLLCIINDILDFSKIEARRLEIEQVPFRLSDVLDNLATIMASTVGDKPVELIVGGPPAGGEFLVGDGLRLGQVLINLVSNAIKFTAQGEVAVAIEACGEAADGEQIRLRFTVRDTGIGIPAEKQALIFHAFAQADSTTTRSFGGTGLGLAISSRLVELMGGELRVASEFGRGSRFFFELSFARSEPANRAVPEMSFLRALIADDHQIAREVLANTASGLGWHAEAVGSGSEALDALGDTDKQPYDVVLLDWRMPEMDGLETAARIRELLPFHQEAPIVVMVTAYDRKQLQSEDRSRYADVVLTKPVTASCLYDAVLEAKHRRGQIARTPRPQPNGPRLAGLRVLVVDDSDINREVAERILVGEGATVELAQDGQAALTALGSRPDAFDIVLMDMQMPVMDGYTATRKIRASRNLAHLPVIALTAGAFKAQRDQALDAGVNAFVAKPFDVDQLVTTIGALSPPVPGQPPATAPASPNGQSPAATSVPELNPSRALEIWGDEAPYRRHLLKFAQCYRDCIETLERDPINAGARLHRMRGAAAQLGVEALAQAGLEAEHALLDGADLAPLIAPLRARLAAALAAIAGYAGDSTPPTATGTPVSAKDLRARLESLAVALDSDDIGAVEPLLDELAASLPAEVITPLRQAAEGYDFTGAKALVSAASRQLNMETEVS